MTKAERIKEAKDKVKKYCSTPGPYQHNLIGLALSSLADLAGSKEADKLIKTLRIYPRFGIPPLGE